MLQTMSSTTLTQQHQEEKFDDDVTSSGTQINMDGLQLLADVAIIELIHPKALVDIRRKLQQDNSFSCVGTTQNGMTKNEKRLLSLLLDGFIVWTGGSDFGKPGAHWRGVRVYKNVRTNC